MAMLTAGLMCPPLRCKLHIARVAMLNPNDSDISSVDGGWSSFHVMVVPVVKKMKKKVARNSTRALAQKWRLFSSDISIISSRVDCSVLLHGSSSMRSVWLSGNASEVLAYSMFCWLFFRFSFCNGNEALIAVKELQRVQNTYTY